MERWVIIITATVIFLGIAEIVLINISQYNIIIIMR